MDPNPLLRVSHLSVGYTTRRTLLGRVLERVSAVDDVSFTIDRGQTLGLVGESGCGKTSTARAVLMLTRPTHGQVLFDGQELTRLGRKQLRLVRRHMQLVHQSPYASLDPRMRVKDIVGEPLQIHRVDSGKRRDDRVRSLLQMVGMDGAFLTRYPHQLSGGQRQRIGIARALALDPALLVCDEPISALDVSIRAQILNLLTDLQARLGLTYLFIAHDLRVVDHVSDKVAVMYLGKIVETGSPSQIRTQTAHPYTRALISAMPVADPIAARAAQRIVLRGDIPSPSAPPVGCRFHTRCWLYQRLGTPARCHSQVPDLRIVGPGHEVACHFSEEMPTMEAYLAEEPHDAMEATREVPADPNGARSA